MIILNCPKCSEAVTLAAGVRDSARVRCPLCQEEYVVSEALGKLPPTLIVVDAASGTEETERPLEPTWETSSDAAGSSPAPFAFTSGRDSTSTASTGAPRISAKPRPKRKPKNPAIEGVKVVGGGIAGLLIAQLILWWFPVTKYRRDPFELGPKVSKSWLGFLVSPDFKGDELTDETSDVSGNQRVRPKAGAGGQGGGLGPDNQPYSEDLGKPSVDWNAVIKSPKDAGAGEATGKKKPSAPTDDDLIIDDLSPQAPADSGLGGIKVDLDGPLSPRGKPSLPTKPTPPAKPAAASKDEQEDSTPPAKPAAKSPSEESENEPAAKPATAKDPPADEKPSGDSPKPTPQESDAKPADAPGAAPKPVEPPGDAKPEAAPTAKPDDSSPQSPE